LGSSRRTHDVFVSYRSSEVALVRRLARRLRRARLKVWLDAWDVLGGDPFGPKIEQGIRGSGAVAVLVGAGGFGPWQKREIAKAVGDGHRRVIPVLLPGARGTRTPIALAGLSRIDLRGGIDDRGSLKPLVAAIKGKPIHDAAGETPRERRPQAARPSPSSNPSRLARKLSGPLSVRGKNHMIAVNGGVTARTITGSTVVTGDGNVVRAGKGRGP
jgi:hypothetical protein